jgi:LuxR family maltose regulon positive regulatory protein
MYASAVTAAGLENDPASPWYALAQGMLGFSRYMSGEFRAAAEPLERAARCEAALPLTRVAALSTQALIAAEEGRLAQARELAMLALPLAQRDDLRQAPSATLAYIATGAAYAAQGQLDEARAELEQALRNRERIPGISQWPTLRATLLLAEVLLDSGDRAGAAELAGEARRVLTALPDGAEAQQAQLEALERRLAAPPRTVLPSEPQGEPLTERELAVLHLLSGTLSLREIGQELYVSANTVKTHTQAIYRKFGVSTRRDAVEQGRQRGMLLTQAQVSVSNGDHR